MTSSLPYPSPFTVLAAVHLLIHLLFHFIYLCGLARAQVKIPQDENIWQSTVNGEVSNGNLQAKENQEKEEEGEEAGKLNTLR